MVSADALANAGNDTGDGVTPTGTQTGGKGWIAIGTDATANTYTNVDGASAAMGYKASAMGKWSTAIGSYSQSTGDSSLALGVNRFQLVTGPLQWVPHPQPVEVIQWQWACMPIRAAQTRLH